MRVENAKRLLSLSLSRMGSHDESWGKGRGREESELILVEKKLNSNRYQSSSGGPSGV